MAATTCAGDMAVRMRNCKVLARPRGSVCVPFCCLILLISFNPLIKVCRSYPAFYGNLPRVFISSLKKGTPFGRSIPVETIIESTPPPRAFLKIIKILVMICASGDMRDSRMKIFGRNSCDFERNPKANQNLIL